MSVAIEGLIHGRQETVSTLQPPERVTISDVPTPLNPFYKKLVDLMSENTQHSLGIIKQPDGKITLSLGERTFPTYIAVVESPPLQTLLLASEPELLRQRLADDTHFTNPSDYLRELASEAGLDPDRIEATYLMADRDGKSDPEKKARTLNLQFKGKLPYSVNNGNGGEEEIEKIIKKEIKAYEASLTR